MPLKVKKNNQNKFYIIIAILFSCTFLPCEVTFSQNFIGGIDIYNRAQFDSLVSFYGPDFLKKNNTEKGLANYFIGESYYNLALEQTDIDSAISYFESAWAALDLAQSDYELEKEYPEFHSFAKYKKGWCSFRLAELSDEAESQYDKAYGEFLSNTHDESPDSLIAFALIMAAESKMLQNSNIFMDQIDKGVISEQFDDVLSSYHIIMDLYDRLLHLLESTSFEKSNALREVAQFKMKLLNFSFSKIYQICAEGFENTPNDDKNINYQQVALALLNDIVSESPPSSLSKLPQPNVDYTEYLNLELLLNNYFLTGSNETKNKFLMAANLTFGEKFKDEVFYKQANIFQNNPDIKSLDLTRLASITYDSAKAIPESYYWNGLLGMINDDYEKSKESFLQFLKIQNTDVKLSRREQILIEDATYQKHLLDFEEFYLSGNKTSLQSLVSAIQDFKPKNRIVSEGKEQLKLLANCSLSGNRKEIWQNVLSGTEDEKLEQALATVQFVLPRAALNIGIVREKYLKLLRVLLRITGQKRGDETIFYSGIVKSLEAEIEPTLFGKIDKFEEAAALLKSVSPKFKNKIEAEYIRGRCLFFADNFEDAKAVLIPLVNEHKSLRALFYLGEMFRLDGFGRAAKMCYEAIISFAENRNYIIDDFWLTNAKAAIEASDDKGDLEILNSIEMNSIVYRPEINSALLTYENLAEEKFLKKRLAREAVAWQIRYGLPVRNIYLSIHRLSNKLVPPGNYYDAMSEYLDEVRGQITTSLALNVILPQGADSNIEVTLDGKILEKSDSLFVERKIPLHSELEINIQNHSCYAFSTNYKFGKPGSDRKTVRLKTKLNFLSSKKEKNVFNDYKYPFGLRKDDNYTLNQFLDIEANSALVIDFNSLMELRDCALDTISQRFLAVNSKENSIWEYSQNGKHLGELKLQKGVRLNSPEGIAVFGNGDIFVADWGNHRIMHLAANGNLINQIGTLKLNIANRIGEVINLVYPTRIFVPPLNDQATSNINEFAQNYLYVADQNGIHVIKTDGTYLDSLVKVNDEFKRGEFYGFFVEEFRQKSKLYVLQRLNSSPGKIFEFVSNLN